MVEGTPISFTCYLVQTTQVSSTKEVNWGPCSGTTWQATIHDTRIPYRLPNQLSIELPAKQCQKSRRWPSAPTQSPMWETQVRLLALTWLSPGHWSHLGCEHLDKDSLSLSDHEIKFLKNFKGINCCVYTTRFYCFIKVILFFQGN